MHIVHIRFNQTNRARTFRRKSENVIRMVASHAIWSALNKSRHPNDITVGARPYSHNSGKKEKQQNSTHSHEAHGDSTDKNYLQIRRESGNRTVLRPRIRAI